MWSSANLLNWNPLTFWRVHGELWRPKGITLHWKVSLQGQTWGDLRDLFPLFRSHCLNQSRKAVIQTSASKVSVSLRQLIFTFCNVFFKFTAIRAQVETLLYFASDLWSAPYLSGCWELALCRTEGLLSHAFFFLVGFTTNMKKLPTNLFFMEVFFWNGVPSDLQQKEQWIRTLCVTKAKMEALAQNLLCFCLV